MLGSVTLDLDQVDKERSTVGGSVSGSANETPAEAEARRRNFSRRFFLGRIRILIRYPMILIFEVVGLHSPDEAMPESSSHRQTNAASHEIIGNFITKMTELLDATLVNRRGERAQNTSNDEALERFLRFRSREFHGEVE
ncbi:hypothetical protein M9H77_29810 [Catharanthus roseus]|uniref:Uncharacterized protein n=1 Tax=Catharanthus roseus TaxID=4058 RepID=A0ACB9ZXP0_CATRO|nr:hypothetical protein M9H77_29810 [Catharanthus roseus]